MRLVGQARLESFARQHADARGPLAAWIAEVEDAQWLMPHDVKGRYRSASFLSRNQVVFNIKGNSYRLICTIAYNAGVVVVSWIGTHAEYDKRN
jgi:mRNA interferase HigB